MDNKILKNKNWKTVYEKDLPKVVLDVTREIETPAVVILSGPVGAGKTTFIKKFVKGLDKNTSGLSDLDQISSPSYSLINEVDSIAHADFYRIKDSEEITHLEMGLYGDDKDYFLIEWGKSFINEIFRELGNDFYYYDLSIEVNELTAIDKKTEQVSSRNIYLKEIK